VELYIRLDETGNPVEHPIFGDNFRQAFPNIDTNNLPSNFAKFIRIQRPQIGVYEKNQQVTYVKGEDGVVRDVWSVEQMTAQEIEEKQTAAKEMFAERVGYTSWIFNEATCTFDPPVPYPSDSNAMYVWDDANVQWAEMPPHPEDGQNYVWDNSTMSWTVVTE
jgi:hypothetical protein